MSDPISLPNPHPPVNSPCRLGCGVLGAAKSYGLPQLDHAFVCKKCRKLAAIWIGKRKAAGLTIGEAATLFEINPVALAEIEWGRVAPTETFVTIMKAVYSAYACRVEAE